ncbi:MAG: acyltransferase [Muribaculaceae bacterium]|nr:acyltransferase [Muribaculaceae bacterium]
MYYIDNLRVLACFLVLLTHSTMPSVNPQEDGVWMFGLSFLGSPSSELFLALSGTVLLPVKTGFRCFYKRRFIKLLPPMVIWSVLGILLYTKTQDMSMSEAVNRIVRIPLQPAISVYWFVYAMGGLYLLAPFISPWLRLASRRQIELFLGLWGINMVLPWILFFYPDFMSTFYVRGNYYWTLTYFGGFLGYWLLGYYLRRYPVKIGFNLKWITILSGTIAYPVAIIFLKRSGCDTAVLLDNLQIGSALLVAFLYTVMQKIRLGEKLQGLVSAVAKYSFCIYLTHIYIARELYWGIFEGSSIHIFPRTFLIAFLTLATGYILTYLLRFFPKGKYITGV